MYSQNQEQSYILSKFNGTIGRFLDIGGYHPTKFSNTRCLVEIGWSGVYVEPSPSCMPSFRKEYGTNPKIQLVEAAVTAQTGKIRFFDSLGDAVSTTEVSHKEKWSKSNAKFVEVEVDTISVPDLISTYGSNFDFLSLDVESQNLAIFNLLPDSFISNLSMICVEHDSHAEYMMRRLSSLGFSKVHQNNENLIASK